MENLQQQIVEGLV